MSGSSPHCVIVVRTYLRAELPLSTLAVVTGMTSSNLVQQRANVRVHSVIHLLQGCTSSTSQSTVLPLASGAGRSEQKRSYSSVTLASSSVVKLQGKNCSSLVY